MVTGRVSKGRQIVLGVLVLAAVGAMLHGARETWRAYRWASADPWPVEAPVLWTVDGQHVAHHRALANRVRPHLLATEPLAVTADPGLGAQAEYLYRWWAFLMPERDVRRSAVDWAGVRPALWLAWDPPGEGEAQVDAEPFLSLGAEGPTLFRVTHNPPPEPVP